MNTRNETKQPIKGFKVTTFEGGNAREKMIDILTANGAQVTQRSIGTLLDSVTINELMLQLDARDIDDIRRGDFIVAYTEGNPSIYLYTGDHLYLIESDTVESDAQITELISMINVQPSAAIKVLTFVFDFLYPLDVQYDFEYELPFAQHIDRKALLRTLIHNGANWGIDTVGLFSFTLDLDGAPTTITITENGKVTLKDKQQEQTNMNATNTQTRKEPNSTLQATQYPGAIVYDRAGQVMSSSEVMDNPNKVEYVAYCADGDYWSVWVNGKLHITKAPYDAGPSAAIWYAVITVLVDNDQVVTIKLPKLPGHEAYQVACAVSNHTSLIFDVIQLEKDNAVVAMAEHGKLVHLANGDRASLINDPKATPHARNSYRDNTGTRIAELYHLRKELISGAKMYNEENYRNAIHNPRGRDSRGVSGMVYRDGGYKVMDRRTHTRFSEELLGDNVKLFLFTEDSKQAGRLTLSETFEAAPYSNRVNGSIDEYINQALLLDEPSFALDVVQDTLLRVADNIKTLNEGMRLMTVLTNYLTNQQAEVISQRELAAKDSADDSNEVMFDNLHAGIADALLLINATDLLLKDNLVPVARKLEALAVIDRSLNVPLGRGSEFNQTEAVVGSLLTSALEISILCTQLKLKAPEFQKKTGWRKFFK